MVPADKYYVPRACGQCHGTEVEDQAGANVNYLDTDHWIDRTYDDFQKVRPQTCSSTARRRTRRSVILNSGIEKQNSAVLGQSPDDPSALLAVRKWLELQRKASRAQKIMSLSYVAVCDGRQ